MTARLARSRFTRLPHTTLWLVLLAGMGVSGAPVGARRPEQQAVPPAKVREAAIDGDEAPRAPVRPARALSPVSVRLGARGLDAGTRSRSAGGATLAAESPTLAPLGAAPAGYVNENDLPWSERGRSPSGIRGPPA